MLQGLDIARYQKTIDWTDLTKSADGSFVIVKATEGATNVDPLFDQHWAAAASARVPRAAYHMLRFNVDGATQAKFFLSTVKLEDSDLVPAVDLERDDSVSPAERIKVLSNFSEVVEAQIKTKIVIYVNQTFWSTKMGGGADYASSPLWVADKESDPPRLPNGWSAWTFWQYKTITGLQGVVEEVDLDRFAGDTSALNAMRIGFSKGKPGCNIFRS